MKTTNNAQKTVSRKMIALCFAVILTFAFLNSSGISRNTIKNQSSAKNTENTIGFKFLPLIESHSVNTLTVHSDKLNTAELKVNLDRFWIEEESDEMLKIESWMLNQNLFGTVEANELTDQDKQLVLEAWMTDKEIWK